MKHLNAAPMWEPMLLQEIGLPHSPRCGRRRDLTLFGFLIGLGLAATVPMISLLRAPRSHLTTSVDEPAINMAWNPRRFVQLQTASARPFVPPMARPSAPLARMRRFLPPAWETKPQPARSTAEEEFVDFEQDADADQYMDPTWFGGTENGTVVGYDADKGFGFIAPFGAVDKEDNLFFHTTGISGGDGTVLPGDRVTFVREYNAFKSRYQAGYVSFVGHGDPGDGHGSNVDRADAADSDRDLRNAEIRIHSLGECTYTNYAKGFGFIQPNNGGEELFYHASGVPGGQMSVHEGDQVMFFKVKNKWNGRYQAEDVTAVA